LGVAQFFLGGFDSAEAVIVMGHIANENVGSVINMLIRKSVVMPINGMQNKVVFSPIEF